MGFSFNPTLLFECRSCKHLFPTTDKLKEHKLSNHLGDCLRIQCIIFKETFRDFSFPIEESTSDFSPHQKGQWNQNQNQNQLSRPISEFCNPYVCLERLNLTEANCKSRKRHAPQSNNRVDYPAKPSKKYDVVSHRTYDTEAFTLPKHAVGGDQTEIPTLTETSISTSTFLSSNENEPEIYLTTEISPSNVNQMEDFDDFIDNEDEFEDQCADLEMHLPKSEDEIKEAAQMCPSPTSSNSSESESESFSGVAKVKMINCEHCSSTFKSKKARRNHMVKMHGKKSNFKCTMCGKYFVQRRDLEDHERRHTKDCPFKCDVSGCSRSFPSKADLYNHRRTVHKPPNSNSQVEMIKCEQCSSTFKSKKARNHHMVNIHGKESNFKCRICEKYFVKRRYLEDHERRHTKDRPFKCDIAKCSSTFSSKYDLSTHHKTVHIVELGLEKFLCATCGKTFGLQNLLNTHVRMHHQKNKPFKCTFDDSCSRSFISRSELTEHVRLVHTFEKPYQCDQCGKSYARWRSFDQHMKAHEGPLTQNIYSCTFCPRKLRSKRYLAAHLKSHESGTMFTCQYCEFQFGLKSALAVHERKVHKEKETVHVNDLYSGDGIFIP